VAGLCFEHDCCLEPVLDLERRWTPSWSARAKMVVELDQPGAATPVRQLGPPITLSRTPASVREPGPALGEHTHAVLRDRATPTKRSPRSRGRRGGRPDRRGVHGSFMG